MNRNLKGSLILILCAFIWGMAFSAQSTATDYIGSFTFVFLRSLITSIVLFAVYPILRKGGTSKQNDETSKKQYLGLGALLGAILFSAMSLQQIGIAYTTAAKSGFVTALYIVIIPLVGLFMGKRIEKKVGFGVVISLIGMAMLCLKDDLSINIGDLITLGCAFVLSFHIIFVDKYAGGMNAILLSAIQFGASALCALPFMLALETISFANILACSTSILYAAVCSGAIGYTLQMIGQKYTEPTLASLLMCLESVFAAIGGWILLGEALAVREIFGCLLMLSASVIAQLPDKNVLRKK